MAQTVYLNALGKFLPGDAVTNDDMEAHLGLVGGKPSRLKARILKQNGIQSRHYAIDRDGKVLFRNYQLAAHAVRDALQHSELSLQELHYLAAATSQSDLLAPGFASLVQGELGLPACEIASLHGVCASGMMALKGAYLQVQSGEKANAVVVASEFTSRFFRHGLFEETRLFKESGRVAFDAEFLRWMLSDGAGAALLENRPNARGLSLRVEWLDLISYADRFDVCMYAGANKLKDGMLDRSWYDYANFAEAAREGAILLKQDIELLDNVVVLGVNRYFALLDEKQFKPAEIDWMVCHYSSHIFRSRIFERLEKGGGMIAEARWFTNLYSKGNTGSASIFIMLEELFNEGKLKAGQKILCMVPESGRFIISFMMLTVVASEPPMPEARISDKERLNLNPHFETVSDRRVDEQRPSRNEAQNLSNEKPPEGGTPNLADELPAVLMRRLAQVWIDFESRLNQVPIVDKINRGKLRVEDYQLLLLNLRQQVMEGARWISRAASNITIDAFELRSMFIGHAADEHRDYQMIERDYLAVGGTMDDITNAEKNLGSEALSAWMFHRASQENPFDLFGAMFIIEGLGNRLAKRWGTKIKEQLGLKNEQVSFLLYHGVNDATHFEKLEKAINSGLLTERLVERIIKTAKVTARLYALQLEELGNT
ncbi:MAG: iron-containing redox enzyme family protein [Acidobacteria bacterium]|nr:iron-containing redox enzyme family protein [Acidobacteriota bacterium]